MTNIINKKIFLFLSIFFWASCIFAQKPISGSLIDGIDFDTSIYKKEELQLDNLIFKSSLLKNVRIKDIRIEDLKNSDYRQEFFLYLENIETFVKLLSIKIKQNRDKDAFSLLQEIYKYKISSRYNDYKKQIYNTFKPLVGLFLDDPYFFIEQSSFNEYSGTDTSLLKFIMHCLKENYFVGEHAIFYTANVELKKGQLWISKISDFKRFIELTEKLKKLPKGKVAYNKSYYISDPESLTDVSSMFGKKLLSKLSSREKTIYDDIVLPVLKQNIVRNYHVNDPDGYVNQRTEPSTSSYSVIVNKIPNGTYVCPVGGENEHWIKVACVKDGYHAYVHKSRLEEK